MNLLSHTGSVTTMKLSNLAPAVLLTQFPPRPQRFAIEVRTEPTRYGRVLHNARCDFKLCTAEREF